VTSLPKAEPRPEKRRRSKRINARVPVLVHLLDPSKRPVTESTHTVVVNAHGALILLAVGDSFMGKTQVAVEFIKPSSTFSQAALAAKRAEVLGVTKP
jgi:hypothetical protein